jgi:hypothetical protein
MFYASTISYATSTNYSRVVIQYPRWLLEDPKPDLPGQLALDDRSIRIQHLNQQRSDLLAQVAKVTTTRSQLIATIDRIHDLIQASTAEINREGAELDRSIHELFNQALNRPKLGVKTKATIERIYRSIQGQIISEQPQPEEPEDPDQIPEPQQQSHYHWQPPSQPEQAEIDPALKQKIRVVYLRLANLYHPDKHPGSVYHAQLMQEINAAYDRGDLTRLLEIEQGTIRSADPTDLTQELLDQIQYLKRQVADLLNKNRCLKNSREYQVSQLIENDRDPIGQMMQALVAQVKLMRQLSKILTDFCNRKIGVKDLLIQLQK